MNSKFLKKNSHFTEKQIEDRKQITKETDSLFFMKNTLR